MISLQRPSPHSLFAGSLMLCPMSILTFLEALTMTCLCHFLVNLTNTCLYLLLSCIMCVCVSMCIYTHMYVCIYESMCTYLLFIYIFKKRRKRVLGVSGAIKIALQEKPFWEASLKEQVWLLQFFHLIFICKYVNDTWKGNKESTGNLEMNIRTSGFFFSLVFKYSLVLNWLNIVKLECMTSFLYLVIW